MKCPCCNEEMEEGYLQTGTRIAWTKEIHKNSLLPSKGEVMLQNNMFKGDNYPYNGVINYKAKGSNEELVVGEWNNGERVIYDEEFLEIKND